MTFSGDLSGIGIADVFQNLAGNRATGTLHVRWDRGERHLRIEGGQVAAWAPGPGRELPLFDHVAERGYADPAAVSELAASSRRRRKRPARALRDQKVCDQESLELAFTEIVAEGVYELLTLSAAHFVFSEGEPPPDVFDLDLMAAEIRLEVGPLLLEGARRADEQLRIRTVVGSDQDLFVADAQAAERAPDELTAAVAELLDGRTDVAGIARQLQRSRFEVSSALLQLVQQGLARPATGEEIAALAELALSTKDRDEAIRLLGQALVRMPREAMLRRRLAETLAAAGRQREAAGEMAVLAFQAFEEERFDEAIAFYDRAIAMDPADVMLHQRRAETLRKTGDREALREGLLQWAHRLENLGLTDRACEVLGTNVDTGPLRNDQRLLLRLAELNKANGNLAAAAQRYVQIVDVHGGGDLNLELRCLRAAAAAQPEDPAIQKRVQDLESGRRARRLQRRRLVLSVACGSCVAVLLLFAAVKEMSQTRRLAAILRDRPADEVALATLPALRSLAGAFSWLPSGKAAAAVADEEAMRMLRHAGHLRLMGQPEQAALALQTARDSLSDSAKVFADDLAQQLHLEAPLFSWLSRIEQRGADDGEACEALARATDPHFFAFHVDLLPSARCEAAREVMLRALQVYDDPRCAEAATTALLASAEPSVQRMCLGLLERCSIQAPERTREVLAVLLEQARQHPERRHKAVQALEVLTAHAAAPLGR